MPKHFDYCILGAGLAGVSLAHELSKEELTICLIDPNGCAGGASGTPLGLVNPATGRYASLTWEAEKCYEKILSNLELIQAKSEIKFFKNSGVLRPAVDEKIATRMKENYLNMDWPSEWIHWLDEKEVKDFHKGITCVDGGVWLPIGLTVDIYTFLNEFLTTVTNSGIQAIFNKYYSYQKVDNNWEITFSNGQVITTKNLVFTTGSSTKKISDWSHIPIIPVKGQLAILETSSPLTFNHAVSALGYISSLNPNRFIIGGTYEHKFEDELTTTQKGLEYLFNRFERVLPELSKTSKVISQWAGVRASTPNRMPIMGKHSDVDGLYIFAGLGSKGLLYSGYLSEIMAQYLMFGNKIPGDLSIDRFN